MVNDVCYGILQDIHGSAENLPEAVKTLKYYGVEAIVLNGDIGDMQPTLEKSQQYLAYVVGKAGESGLDVYVQPGSHESVGSYMPVLNHLSKNQSNIHDCLKPENQKVDKGSYHLVFLPGSDWVAGGEFMLNQWGKTGLYIKAPEGNYPYSEGMMKLLVESNSFQGYRYIQNMVDLDKQVTEPEKTLIFCHIPPRFNNLNEAIDMANFGVATKGFNLEGREIDEGSIFPIKRAIELYKQGAPLDIKQENRGNNELGSLYRDNGIRKAVSGHFHESGGRANDWKGNHVPEKNSVEELFYNPGSLTEGKIGIIWINGTEVSYENIPSKLLH